MPGSYDEREITFEIVEEIGVISAHPTGWAKEINLVSWNGGQPKYDIREWSPAHDQMSRGITLNEKEMRLIIELLRRRSRSSLRASSGRRGGSSAGGSGSGTPEHAPGARNERDGETAAPGREDQAPEEERLISEREQPRETKDPEEAFLTAEVEEKTISAADMAN